MSTQMNSQDRLVWWTLWLSHHIVTLLPCPLGEFWVRSKFSGRLEIWPLQKSRCLDWLQVFILTLWQTDRHQQDVLGHKQIYSDILLGLAASLIEFMVQVKFAQLTFRGIFIVNIYQRHKSADWIFYTATTISVDPQLLLLLLYLVFSANLAWLTQGDGMADAQKLAGH